MCRASRDRWHKRPPQWLYCSPTTQGPRSNLQMRLRYRPGLCLAGGTAMFWLILPRFSSLSAFFSRLARRRHENFDPAFGQASTPTTPQHPSINPLCIFLTLLHPDVWSVTCRLFLTWKRGGYSCNVSDFHTLLLRSPPDLFFSSSAAALCDHEIHKHPNTQNSRPTI